MGRVTTEGDSAVDDYLASLDDQTAADSATLIEMMQRISGREPTLWNVGTLGFGTYHYKYDSGREGDGHTIGFYPRKGKITVYLMDGKHATRNFWLDWGSIPRRATASISSG